jgi:hypothetical protein
VSFVRTSLRTSEANGERRFALCEARCAIGIEIEVTEQRKNDAKANSPAGFRLDSPLRFTLRVPPARSYSRYAPDFFLQLEIA